MNSERRKHQIFLWQTALVEKISEVLRGEYDLRKDEIEEVVDTGWEDAVLGALRHAMIEVESDREACAEMVDDFEVATNDGAPRCTCDGLTVKLQRIGKRCGACNGLIED
jgi:hypothetical protein